MRHVSVTNSSKAVSLGEQIAVADSSVTRFFGLMGKHELAPGTGLLIEPSSGVHTCWMRMRIDIIALDRANRIVKLGREVKPWRVSCLGLKVHRVLELPSGRIRATGTDIGDLVSIARTPLRAAARPA